MGSKRRFVRAMTVLLLVIGVLGLAPATPEANAANGLRMTVDITYDVDVDAGSVYVTSDAAVTNTTPNRTSGNTITRFYFDKILVPIPLEAQNLVATSAG